MLKINYERRHLINAGTASRRAAKNKIPRRVDIAEALKSVETTPARAKDNISEGKCTGRTVDVQGKSKLLCPSTCPVHPLESADLVRTATERPPVNGRVDRTKGP